LRKPIVAVLLAVAVGVWLAMAAVVEHHEGFRRLRHAVDSACGH
jgi:hypothetical protein